MIWLIISWWCLALAIVAFAISCAACIGTVRSMQAPVQSVESRIRHMLLEGFSVWRISDELQVSAGQVHEVMERIMREAKG